MPTKLIGYEFSCLIRNMHPMQGLVEKQVLELRSCVLRGLVLLVPQSLDGI